MLRGTPFCAAGWLVCWLVPSVHVHAAGLPTVHRGLGHVGCDEHVQHVPDPWGLWGLAALLLQGMHVRESLPFRVLILEQLPHIQLNEGFH